MEPTFYEYLENLWLIFDEVYRILKPTGTCWVNLGDTYFGASSGTDTTGFNDAKGHRGVMKGRTELHNLRKSARGYPEKCLCMIPSRFAEGMVDRGWIVRQEIIWFKKNSMPDPHKDRFRVDFEKIYLFSKARKYWFSYNAIKVPLAGATMEGNRYPIGVINRMDKGVNHRNVNEHILMVDRGSPIGGHKHANHNTNKKYSGNIYEVPSDNMRKLGCVWIWGIAPQTFGYEYCPQCDRLVADRDLLFKCVDGPGGKVKGCGHIYERLRPADIAKANGLDPEAPCIFCGRKLKRHISPNSRDRAEGLRNEFINCPGMENLQFKISGCPKCGNKYKDLQCNFCKKGIHAHYAMFPEELAKIPVTAGCPEYVCNKCSVPRFPIYEPTEEYKKYLGKGWTDHTHDDDQGMMQEKQMPSAVAEYKIVDWTDCGCNSGFSPGIILDPFMGFGTVASVALQNGRNFIGIDLDPFNIRAAKKRVEPYYNQKLV